MAAKTDEGLVWGGLGLAAVVGLIFYQKTQAAAAASASPPLLSPYPSIPSTSYAPLVMTAPGYTPPVVGAAPPPAVVVGAAPPPAMIAAPAPAVVVGPSAAQSNAAFQSSMTSAHQYQQDAFASGSADLLAKVQSGQIAPGSEQYRQTFDYLANLTGGVATSGQEAAKLTAAGLPKPA